MMLVSYHIYVCTYILSHWVLKRIKIIGTVILLICNKEISINSSSIKWNENEAVDGITTLFASLSSSSCYKQVELTGPLCAQTREKWGTLGKTWRSFCIHAIFQIRGWHHWKETYPLPLQMVSAMLHFKHLGFISSKNYSTPLRFFYFRMCLCWDYPFQVSKATGYS